MASATITFHNEDGWLPIDFNEVSITRRAYRDGQNEYLLNGQRVRLKEISELLARSGLSERTYTIIGQGLVDAALSLKPEERRKFFEEAAGIGLYRSRREEALTRLDITRRNLERVQDILNELGPRLASLEKQARRVQEYERIRADLRLLLRDWYGYHWHRLQREVVQSLESFHAQEARLERARERQAEVEIHQSEVRNRLGEIRKELNNWHTISAALHTQWEKVSRSLAVMDERQRALQTQQQGLVNDLRRLEDEQKERQDRLIFLHEERDRLQSEQKEAEEEASQARKELEIRQADRMHVEQDIRETRRALVQAETTRVQLKAHQDELANRVEALHKNRQSIVKSLETEAQLLQQLQAGLEAQRLLHQQAEQAHQSAEGQLAEHRKRIAEMEAQRKNKQEERDHVSADRARIAAQLEVLEQAERTLSGLANGAKFLLQETRQGRLKGSFQLLNDQLVVPAELETAVAAALGEYLDSVVVEHEVDIESALNLLTGSNKGRAVLIAPDRIEALPEVAVPADEGVLGLASSMIEAPQKIQNLVRLLLGQVIIVRDRNAARRLLGSLPLATQMVTLQGEVFNVTGVVIAGADSRSSAISRPRRIRELQSALSSAEQQLSDSLVQLKEFEQGLDRLHLQESEAARALRQAAQDLSQASQLHQRAMLDVEQARQRFEFQSHQALGLDGQIQHVEQEIRRGQEEIGKNSQQIDKLNDQIRERNRLLGSLPVEDLQAKMAHWNTAAAVAARALKDAERRLSEHMELVAANARQIELIQHRLADVEAGLVQLDTEKHDLHRQEGSLAEQIEGLRLQIEPAEAQLELVEKEGSDLQGMFVAAQQAVSVAERHTSQAHLELSRARESLDSLRRRIEEDFGLVTLESAPEVASQTPLPLEGMVEQLPVLTELPPEVDENISRQRALLRRMGPINFEVESEYLKKADAGLREVITDLDDLMRREFRKTFDAVAAEFKVLFTRLFNGGAARLVLSDPEDPIEAGIDIEARLPGRREQGLSLLSGGERSLTAVALIFSLLKVSPTPFCVMDEVDAMLDESNVGRFRDLLHELSDHTQFILVTHNRNTVQAANVIYGVTMGRDSASQVISLRLDEISEELVR
jgi:chromosome segregation protein